MLRGNNLTGFGRRRVLAGAAGITLVGTSSGAATLTMPAGLQENDYVIVQLAADSYETNSIAGWTTIQTRLSSARGITVAKFMGATPDTSLSVNSNNSTVCMAFRGVNLAQPQDVANTSSSSGSSGNPNPAAITPVTDGCAIVISASLDDKRNAGSITVPAGFTDLVDSDTGGSAATAMMAWALQGTAATIDPAAFVTSPNDEYWTATQALRPA